MLNLLRNEVAYDGTQASLNRARRKLALRLHPDKGGDADLFRAVMDALKDPLTYEWCLTFAMPARTPRAPPPPIPPPERVLNDDGLILAPRMGLYEFESWTEGMHVRLDVATGPVDGCILRKADVPYMHVVVATACGEVCVRAGGRLRRRRDPPDTLRVYFKETYGDGRPTLVLLHASRDPIRLASRSVGACTWVAHVPDALLGKTYPSQNRAVLELYCLLKHSSIRTINKNAHLCINAVGPPELLSEVIAQGRVAECLTRSRSS
jgi:hypothetical protein